jgi:hypothetical protein
LFVSLDGVNSVWLGVELPTSPRLLISILFYFLPYVNIFFSIPALFH